MLLNPYKTALQAIPGTRILSETLGLLGVAVQSMDHPSRIWTITSILAPVKGRHLGGIRVKLEDAKGFITFCNQRDLELLLALAKPGNMCPWLNAEYPEMDSREFYGLCMDEEDMKDDLFERELMYRTECPGVIPFGTQMTRLMHIDKGHDVEQMDMMLHDCDRATGLGPDLRMETVDTRWTRVERNKVQWEMI